MNMLTEKETMLRAKMYMLKLAAGINPIDDSDISNDSALQNERLKKCFTYVAEVLDNASGNKNNIKKGYKEPRAARQPFSITSDEIASIELIPHDCVISELTAVINEAAEKDGMKKLQAARINDWLVNQGYLQDNTNAQGKNTRELTPKSIGKLVNFPQCLFMKPMGEAFDDFIVNDVMPEIEKNFPVKVGRENTAICGSSSGGLQAYYTAVNHADVFSYAGVFSPVWLLYSVKSVVNWTKSKMKSQMPFLYIYSGGNGGLEKHIFKNSQKVIAELSNFYPQNLIKVDLRADMIHQRM